MGPQVRDSRRIYRTALRRPPPETTVSHPNVTLLDNDSFHIRFNGNCQRPRERFNSNFAASPGLYFWPTPALYLVSPKIGSREMLFSYIKQGDLWPNCSQTMVTNHILGTSILQIPSTRTCPFAHFYQYWLSRYWLLRCCFPQFSLLRYWHSRFCFPRCCLSLRFIGLSLPVLASSSRYLYFRSFM